MWAISMVSTGSMARLRRWWHQIMWIKCPAGRVLYALPLVVWVIRNRMGHREIAIEWRSPKDRPEARCGN